MGVRKLKLYRLEQRPEYIKVYIRGYSGAYTTVGSIVGVFNALQYYSRGTQNYTAIECPTGINKDDVNP